MRPITLQETRLIIAFLGIIIITYWLIYLLILLLHRVIFSVLGNISRRRSKGIYKKKLSIRIFHLCVIFIEFVILSLSLYEIYNILFIPVAVIDTAPRQGSKITSSYDNIVIEFDKPIRYGRLQISISPDYFKYEVKPICLFDGFLKNIELSSQISSNNCLVGGVQIIPLSSVDPRSNLVVYFANIQSFVHVQNVRPQEYALNLVIPQEINNLNPVNIGENQNNVLPDQPIILRSTEPILDNLQITTRLSPFCDFVKTLKKSPYEIKISCGKPLQQGQKYHLEVKGVSVYSERESSESMYVVKEIKADERVLTSLDFYTVNPPGIKKFKPTGEDVHADTDITIEFDEAMNTNSVLQHLKISPIIDYEARWNEDFTKLTINPDANLKKDTKYTIVFEKGIKTAKGGVTHKDIKYTFKTIGKVKVISISPRNGSTGLPTKPTIAIKFNQEVDHASAQSHFKLTPHVKGKFWWKGNTMYFKPTSSLKYLIKYKITISAGIKSKYGLNSTKTYTSYFTTKSATFILGVPLYHQQETFTCNVASTRMALAYKGIYLSESQIKSGIGIGQALNGSTGGDPNRDWINNYGVHWDPVASFIRRYRKASVKRNWNTVSLVKEVRAGHPVILWWHNRFSSFYWKTWTTSGGYKVTGLNGMHSEVVVGFKGSVDNPSVIIVNDPWRGRLYYSRKTFEWNWRRSFNNTAVVVY